jgi:hypothetical protein
LLLLPYFIQAVVHEFCSCGFPHSDICGSKGACPSPQLFAACHVLHRLEVPRHPPCALSSLTIKFTQEQQTLLRKPRSLIDACTVKLALCVSLLSDITPGAEELLPQETSRDVGQQSLFDCQRSLLIFDQRRNFSFQKPAGMLDYHILLPKLERSSSAPDHMILDQIAQRWWR